MSDIISELSGIDPKSLEKNIAQAFTGKDTKETHTSTIVIEADQNSAKKAVKTIQPVSDSLKEIQKQAEEASAAISSSLQQAKDWLKTNLRTKEGKLSGSIVRAMSLFGDSSTHFDLMEEFLPGVVGSGLKLTAQEKEESARGLIEAYRAYQTVLGDQFNLTELEEDLPGVIQAVNGIKQNIGTSALTINNVFAHMNTILRQEGVEGLESYCKQILKESSTALDQVLSSDGFESWEVLKTQNLSLKAKSEISEKTIKVTEFIKQMNEAYASISSAENSQAVESMVMAEWIKRISSSKKPSQERALYLKNGLPVYQEIFGDKKGVSLSLSDAKALGATTIAHSHGYNESLDYLGFSAKDIQTLVAPGVQRALLVCGNELLSMDFGSMPDAEKETVKQQIIQMYHAAAAAFGGSISLNEKGLSVDATKLSPEIQNALNNFMNYYITETLGEYTEKYGASMQSLKFGQKNGQTLVEGTTDQRMYIGEQYWRGVIPFAQILDDEKKIDQTTVRQLSALQQTKAISLQQTEVQAQVEEATKRTTEAIVEQQQTIEKSISTNQTATDSALKNAEAQKQVAEANKLTIESIKQSIDTNQQLTKEQLKTQIDSQKFIPFIQYDWNKFDKENNVYVREKGQYSKATETGKAQMMKAIMEIEKSMDTVLDQALEAYVRGYEKDFEKFVSRYQNFKYTADRYRSYLTTGTWVDPQAGASTKKTTKKAKKTEESKESTSTTTVLNEENQALDANTEKVEKNTKAKSDAASKSNGISESAKKNTQALEAEAKAAEQATEKIEKTVKAQNNVTKQGLLNYINKKDYAKIGSESDFFAKYGVDKTIKDTEQRLESYRTARAKFFEEKDKASVPTADQLFEKYNELKSKGIQKPFADAEFAEMIRLYQYYDTGVKMFREKIQDLHDLIQRETAKAQSQVQNLKTQQETKQTKAKIVSEEKKVETKNESVIHEANKVSAVEEATAIEELKNKKEEAAVATEKHAKAEEQDALSTERTKEATQQAAEATQQVAASEETAANAAKSHAEKEEAKAQAIERVKEATEGQAQANKDITQSEEVAVNITTQQTEVLNEEANAATQVKEKTEEATKAKRAYNEEIASTSLGSLSGVSGSDVANNLYNMLMGASDARKQDTENIQQETSAIEVETQEEQANATAHQETVERINEEIEARKQVLKEIINNSQAQAQAEQVSQQATEQAIEQTQAETTTRRQATESIEQQAQAMNNLVEQEKAVSQARQSLSADDIMNSIWAQEGYLPSIDNKSGNSTSTSINNTPSEKTNSTTTEASRKASSDYITLLNAIKDVTDATNALNKIQSEAASKPIITEESIQKIKNAEDALKEYQAVLDSIINKKYGENADKNAIIHDDKLNATQQRTLRKTYEKMEVDTEKQQENRLKEAVDTYAKFYEAMQKEALLMAKTPLGGQQSEALIKQGQLVDQLSEKYNKLKAEAEKYFSSEDISKAITNKGILGSDPTELGKQILNQYKTSITDAFKVFEKIPELQTGDVFTNLNSEIDTLSQKLASGEVNWEQFRSKIHEIRNSAADITTVSSALEPVSQKFNSMTQEIDSHSELWKSKFEQLKLAMQNLFNNRDDKNFTQAFAKEIQDLVKELDNLRRVTMLVNRNGKLMDEGQVHNVDEMTQKMQEFAKQSGLVATSTPKVEAELGRVTMTARNQAGEVVKLKGVWESATNSWRVSTTAMASTGTVLKTLTSGFTGLAKGIASMTGLSMMAMRVRTEISKGLSTFKEYDATLTNISYTMDLTSKELQNMGQSAIEMAKDLSMSVSNAESVFKIYANMNTTAEDIQRMAKPTVILSNLSGVDASTAADEVQGILQQFNMLKEGEQDVADVSMHIVDVLDKISANVAMDYSINLELKSEMI